MSKDPGSIDQNVQPAYPSGPPSYGEISSDPMIAHPFIAHQPAPTGPTTIIIQTHSVGPTPQIMTCPNCRANITTNVKSTPILKTHLMACLCCALGLWFCFCIPYCVDSCQGQEHTCPNCGNFLGIHK